MHGTSGQLRFSGSRIKPLFKGMIQISEGVAPNDLALTAT
jgi:hypothetical protein